MQKTTGNLEGIKRIDIEKLDSLYSIISDSTVYIGKEALDIMAYISSEYNKEVSVYIARNGQIVNVCVGNSTSVSLESINMRRGTQRLSAIRCIHTHPSGSPYLSSMDTSALCLLKLDSMSSVAINEGRATLMQTAVINPLSEDGYKILDIVNCNNIPHEILFQAIKDAEIEVDRNINNEKEEKERVLLVSIDDEASLYELKALAETALVDVVDQVLQKKSKPDPATYIGEGKAEEISRLVQQKRIDTVICDDEISGSTQKRLEEIFACRVIDRTTLILDIFAKHCKSAESKLQVEAAQLKYRSQHLIGIGSELSRLGGGIGTKGPGESKLEIDRRRIRERLNLLEKEIENIASQRALRRKDREKNNIPTVALVGYTNAGKSTLLNQLTGANAYVEDKLFATLDSLSRKLKLDDGQEILVVDTVGFIRKLPHYLVKAFSSTLEEAKLADILIIVLDGANEEVNEHYKTVCDTLEEIGATSQKRIVAINKIDKFKASEYVTEVQISAKYGEGIQELKKAISEALSERYCTATYEISYNNMSVLPLIHENGKVYSEEYTENGVSVRANLPVNMAKKLISNNSIKVIGK